LADYSMVLVYILSKWLLSFFNYPTFLSKILFIFSSKSFQEYGCLMEKKCSH